ncbi:hypothetical protein B4U80_14869 [Leptotrombidium deliense]|uniref:Serpin domain-containing protein n=1 Tax=Leptotrombidium deliense TaxID=299467 RepID=A0A443SAN9_9ACAR|nr:hypothetical protein B4U80_14869 [Leptotrombidium deliense]
MSMSEVHISIPKFSVVAEKSKSSYRSNKDFEQLTTRSHLSEVSDVEDLTFSEILAMNSFALNEEGIRFSSLSATSSSGRNKKTKNSFICNRPFLFFVFPKNENLALLLGMIDKLYK